MLKIQDGVAIVENPIKIRVTFSVLQPPRIPEHILNSYWSIQGQNHVVMMNA